MDRYNKYLLAVLFALSVAPVKGQKAGLTMDNQVSSWVSLSFFDPPAWQTGARFIPTLSPYLQLDENKKVDAEISVNTYGNFLFSGFHYDTTNYNLKPYRLWMRFSAAHLEIRAGLQKINFGSAYIFRPLMWFDKMDFRDPLQLTDGVYSLLGRYYFNNNINIWLWGLYGNNKTKGWEIAPSVKDIPEFGGRFQIPAGKGELAASYHHRIADYAGFTNVLPPGSGTEYNEQMFAIDGKWDMGIGLWFEYVKKLNDRENQVTGKWETYYSIGFDYTFNVGNGLNLISEFFHYANNPDNNQQKTKSNFSTISLNYPIFLSHNISGLVYYNWETNEWYRFVNLQFKYDYLSLYLMTFWNPDEFTLYSGSDGKTLFAGKGFQVMIVLDI
jgi:hypothetical protein